MVTKICASSYALITCMRLLRVSRTRVLKLPYRDQRSLNTSNACMRFFQQQSSTDLHTVACNLGQLNAGAKIRASYYRARFALSAAVSRQGGSDQRRCAKAYMSHDIPSRARAFLGVETGYGARIKALACTFIGVGGVRPRD